MAGDMEIRGVYTALVTPFDNEGGVDYDGLRDNIQQQLAAGVSGLVVLGTTGETPVLKSEERAEIVRTAIECAQSKVQIVVGTGTNCTRTTIKESLRAQELGADGVLVVTPYYNKPGARGVIEHYRALSAAIEIPFIQYNVQSRTGINVSAQTMMEISKLPGAVAVKEASGDIEQAGEIVRAAQAFGRDFAVLSGDDALTLPMISVGGRGVVSVASNLLPESIVALVGAALAGDFTRALELHQQLSDLFKETFIETNPVPIKYCMQRSGLAAGGVRLPLVELGDDSKLKLNKLLESIGGLK